MSPASRHHARDKILASTSQAGGITPTYGHHVGKNQPTTSHHVGVGIFCDSLALKGGMCFLLENVTHG